MPALEYMIKKSKAFFRIDFYVPLSHLENLKSALFEAGAGKLGDYDSCCWQTQGVGQFRPLPGSSPFIGKEMKLEKVEEFKVELIFPKELKKQILEAFKRAHPYEKPAYQIIKVSLG